MKTPQYSQHWVANQADLDKLAGRLTGQPLIAMDTEFMRTQTFYPIPALIQFAIPGEVFLVDCVALPDLSILSPIMIDAQSTKLFHSVGEDLTVLERLGLPDIHPVVDTQIAAAWLGYPLQHAFQKLVAEELGVTLDKAATRTDWLARPLSDSQIQYAVEDVVWLLEIYTSLKTRLDQKTLERIPVMVRETADKLKEATEPERYYLRLRAGSFLSASQQARLQALAAWRERCCQRENVTRNRVVSDRDLITIAEHYPRTREALAQVTALRGAGLRKRADAILAILKDDKVPAQPTFGKIAQPLPKSLKARFAALKAAAERLSTQQGWPQTLVFDRKLLEQLAQDQVVIEHSGWRKPFIEQLLAEAENT